MSRSLPSSSVVELASTDAYAWCLKVPYTNVTTGDIDYIRVTSNPVDISTKHEDTSGAAVTYNAVPFEFTPLKETDDASNFEEWKLTFPDPAGLIKSWIRQNESLTGREAIAALVMIPLPSGATPTATTTAVLEEQFLIKELNMVETSVQWVLGSRNFLYHTFPGRRVYRTRCGHVFRGQRCGYGLGLHGSGEDLGVKTCDYTYNGANGCQVKGNTGRFGGYLNIPFGTDRD